MVGSLAAWAILTNEMLRARLAEAVQAIRERVAAMRSSASDDLDVDADDPVAFVAAETIPIETAPYADDAMTDATPFVEGIGASHEDVSPALEEMGVRD